MPNMTNTSKTAYADIGSARIITSSGDEMFFTNGDGDGYFKISVMDKKPDGYKGSGYFILNNPAIITTYDCGPPVELFTLTNGKYQAYYGVRHTVFVKS